MVKMTRHFLNPLIPTDLPADLVQKINELKRYKTKSEVLDAAYEMLTRKYRGYRIKTITHLPDLFRVDLAKMWSQTGFLHCTKMNFLLCIMLVGSGQFRDDDIKLKWTTINFLSPHQYVQIRVADNQWVDVDLWGNAYGIRFGDHGHGFHSGSMVSRPGNRTN